MGQFIILKMQFKFLFVVVLLAVVLAAVQAKDVKSLEMLGFSDFL